MSALRDAMQSGVTAVYARFKLSAEEKQALAMMPAGPYRVPGAALNRPAPAPAGGGMMRGLRNTALGVGVGAAAAGAAGLGYQNTQDQQQYPLVYQPMASGFGH